MDLAAIAIRLDLIDPVVSRRRTLTQARVTGFDESRKFRLACASEASRRLLRTRTQTSCRRANSIKCSPAGSSPELPEIRAVRPNRSASADVPFCDAGCEDTLPDSFVTMHREAPPHRIAFPARRAAARDK